MLDFNIPDKINILSDESSDNYPLFIKCLSEHGAHHVLVDIRRIIIAEELDHCKMRLTLDCGNGAIKEIIVDGFVSRIEDILRQKRK